MPVGASSLDAEAHIPAGTLGETSWVISGSLLGYSVIGSAFSSLPGRSWHAWQRACRAPPKGFGKTRTPQPSFLGVAPAPHP